MYVCVCVCVWQRSAAGGAGDPPRRLCALRPLLAAGLPRHLLRPGAALRGQRLGHALGPSWTRGEPEPGSWRRGARRTRGAREGEGKTHPAGRERGALPGVVLDREGRQAIPGDTYKQLCICIVCVYCGCYSALQCATVC
jgi:hypothetical protein